MLYECSPLLNLLRSCWAGKDSHDDENAAETEQSQERKNTYLDGMVHVLRATVSTGILAMPAAFSRAGYLGGAVGIALISFVANHCALSLVSCQREHARRDPDMVVSYQATVGAAFAAGPKRFHFLRPFVMEFTNLSILMGQLAGMSVSILFIASNLKMAIQPHLDYDLVYYELVVYLVIAGLSLIPDLKKLAVVSLAGNVVLLLSVVVIFFYDLKDPISLEGKSAFGNYKEYPQFIGMIFYSTITITVVLPLQKEMAREDALEGHCGVLNASAYIYGTVYIFFGLFGYLKFGDSVAGSITLNLPPGELLSRSVQAFLALAALSSCALINYVAVSMIWSDYLEKRLTKHQTLVQIILKFTVVTVAMLIAVLVPNLKTLVSVSGVIVQSTLNTTLPCLVNALTHYKQPSLWKYVQKFWVDVIAMTLTALVLLSGLTFSLMDVFSH